MGVKTDGSKKTKKADKHKNSSLREIGRQLEVKRLEREGRTGVKR